MESVVKFESLINSQIEKAISSAVEEHKEELIAAAVEEFEKRVRKVVGEVALHVSNHFSIQRMGKDIVITVKMEKGGEGE